VTLVTAAITTYNRAQYLPEAIDSVLAQSVPDVEVLVIDDGSTDDTEAAIAPYRDRIRYVRRPQNGGRAAARNTAVELATGQFLAFCDSDDAWLPNRLARQLAAFEGRPEVGMVHGQVEIVDEAGNALADRTAAHRALFAAAHPATYASYALNCRCLSSTVLVRRLVFDRIGLYALDLPTEDYDLYLRLLLEFEMIFLDWPPLARYRIHPGQVETERLGLGQIRTAERHLSMLQRRDDIPNAGLARRNFELMIAQTWRVLGERRRSRAAALCALLHGAPQALRLVV
jgi:glycosyltransferase involved in cell wall biosynthesis